LAIRPARSSFLGYSTDGTTPPRTSADHAGIGASTASQHLKLLVDERLARVRAQGRHRYFMLADANVAHALEALLRVADGALPETTRWQAPAMRGLRHARTCYGHLAGELGVRLCQCFVQRGWVHASEGDGHDYPLTQTGVAELKQLGLPIRTDAGLPGKRMLYGCVDWSERRDHFAGPLAVTMLDTFIERDWLRRNADSRVLDVTTIGQATLVASLIETDR
jgi:hypothetical protein